MNSEAKRRAHELAKMGRKAIADSRKARAVHKAELKVRTVNMLIEIIGLFVCFALISAITYFALEL